MELVNLLIGYEREGRRLFRLYKIWIVMLALFVTGCDGPSPVRLPETPVGLEATIRSAGRDFDVEITAFENGVSTMDRFWHGETISSERHYRGLYQVGVIYQSGSIEVDIDEKAVDDLFPLKVGKTVSFEGSFSQLEKSAVSDIWVHMEVVKESSIVIDDRSWKTWIIEIQTQFDKGETSDTALSTIHYSEELGMILKKTIREDGHQYFWRVTRLKQPEDAGELRARPGQNRGTIMI